MSQNLQTRWYQAIRCQGQDEGKQVAETLRRLLFGQYERLQAFTYFTEVLWGKAERTKSGVEKKQGRERELFHVWMYYRRLFWTMENKYLLCCPKGIYCRGA